MKISGLIKVVFVLVLFVAAFHLSGIESAFCEDGILSGNVEKHGCMTCAQSHHPITVDSVATPFFEIPVNFLVFDEVFLGISEPQRSILRPPIFA